MTLVTCWWRGSAGIFATFRFMNCRSYAGIEGENRREGIRLSAKILCSDSLHAMEEFNVFQGPGSFCTESLN